MSLKSSLCKDLLGIFAKHPLPGEAKTRLAASTSPAWSAGLAEAFLRDAVRRWGCFPARRLLVYTPSSAYSYFGDLAAGCFEFADQGLGDLGERLARFFSGAFVAGAQRVVVIGTDSPTLTQDYVQEAFSALATVDVVFGPAFDGGYCLLGCSGFFADLFADIPWGSSGVLDVSLSRVRNAGLRWKALPSRLDVDTTGDLAILMDQIADLRERGRDPGLPATEAYLRLQPIPAHPELSTTAMYVQPLGPERTARIRTRRP